MINLKGQQIKGFFFKVEFLTSLGRNAFNSTLIPTDTRVDPYIHCDKIKFNLLDLLKFNQRPQLSFLYIIRKIRDVIYKSIWKFPFKEIS